MTTAERAAESPHRFPPWLPLALVWAVWACSQVIVSLPQWRLAFPGARGWLFAIPQLLLPFDASFYGVFAVAVPVLTPFALVLLDLAADKQWSLSRAGSRHAITAAWFGASAALAPSVGIGVVWTGQASFAQLAAIFLSAAVSWYVAFMVVALVVAGVRRILASALPNRRFQQNATSE